MRDPNGVIVQLVDWKGANSPERWHTERGPAEVGRVAHSG